MSCRVATHQSVSRFGQNRYSTFRRQDLKGFHHRFFGGSFSTIVRVDESILDERGEAAAAVHGISKEEIAEGFIFPVAWRMFSDWLEAVLNATITASNDSEPEAVLSTGSPFLSVASRVSEFTP